ncbi:BTAD domain-containing putative transcriptional regulator [Actinoplanes sp. NPDC026670]|uniref:BTAD domain-containing putative transcriptional regulator n=1 Tax=Actinoplanes sp. NPDC026670 TaxID=3154700 RepID=UPI0033D591C8
MCGDAPETLSVSVLGPVRAWAGERELPLGSARQRAVFASLAAAARPVGRDELIASVWGDTAPATAVGNLYTYVSGLRRVLGHDRLTSGPSGYALRLTPGALDSERFERLCAEAAGQDATAAAATLDEALRLWHGEAYAGLAGDRFELERARLAERRLAAAQQRARVLTDLGDDGAVAELAGLVREHPLHEPLHELLVAALDRAGRRAEARQAYRSARETLRAELGVQPGPALAALHERIGPGSDTRPAAGRVPLLRVLPEPVAQDLDRKPRNRVPGGRDSERERLRDLVTALVAGHGRAVWIEGEPGIGKSELITAVFAGLGGCHLAWSIADGEDTVSRALGRDGADGDHLLAYVRTLCASAPLVLIVDDLHRADDPSLDVWQRLTAFTRRMPLLLVAATRPDAPDGRLAGPRRLVQSRRGHLLRLGPLPTAAIERLVADLAGAPPGPNLASVVPLAGGNPLYAREMTTPLLRAGLVQVSGGVAEIPGFSLVQAPPSLLATVGTTVLGLSPGARDVLRSAAVLGPRFAVDDLATVTGRSPLALLPTLEEAIAADVVTEAGADLAFRLPVLRQALYESIPAADRPALHRHTAETLHRDGCPVTRVAEQLVAPGVGVDDWTAGWLAEHHGELARRAPQVAAALLHRALDSPAPGPDQRERLLIAAVRLDFRHERAPSQQAREAARVVRDPAERAEMRHLLATMIHRQGETAAAVAVLAGALSDPDLPALWRTRHLVLLAGFRRGPLDDLDEADRAAGARANEALAAGRPHEAAYALQTSWLIHSIRRDHERALGYVDRALTVMRDDQSFAGMYLDLLDNRTFTLQNLDRLEAAERTLREGALFALRHRLPSGLHAASVVQHYWRGRWDDALAEVGTVTDGPRTTLLGMREPTAITTLLHGVAALIAAQRDDPVLAGGHLSLAEALPASDAERENSDFQLVARAYAAEQQGRADDAIRMLEPLLVPDFAPLMLRHQWLPYLTRLALDRGHRDIAERAARLCADEAAREVHDARAGAAARRCHALLAVDPEPMLAVAGHYLSIGRTTELAVTLEDAAVLLAVTRRPHEAARTGGDAVRLHRELGARWDERRARARLEEYGVDPAGQRTSISNSE